MANPAQLAEQALALHQAGRLKEAAPLYDRALAARPNDARLLGLAGALHLQAGKLALGVKLLKRAVAARRDHAEAWHNLGFALLQLGRHAEAAEAFAAVTRLQPQHAGAWLGLGHAEREAARPEAALAAYRQAVVLQPDNAAALGSLGALLNMQGRMEEAEPLLRRAVALQPDNPSLHNNLGMAVRRQRRLAEAEAIFRHCMAQFPGYAMGFENAGDLLLAEGRAAEAGPLLQQAIALHEAARSQVSAELLGGLLSARTQLCDWQDRDALLARVLHAPGSPPNIFELLWQPVAPARLKRAAEAHAASLRPPPAPPLLRAAGTDRLRIGYLSADFHQHATAYLIAEVLERHDRARFDILAYSTGPDDGSAMRARLAAAVGHFHDCAALPDRALAERIAADGLDLLVDLKGWTRDGRVQALAYRPAPLQASWLGFPGTLGADWIDYAIVDPILAPPGSEAQFTESLLRLPHCYQPNDRQRAIGDTPGRAEAGLPEHALVLACFCQAAKITPAVFAAWMRALATLPDAVLWLLQPLPAAAANLQREAAARGIDPARILFAPKLPLDRHLARYRLVDLALDTTPYGSHTTASDALWAGCPQLAITGDSFAARVSTSIVAAAGVPELAAPDLPTHEAMILRLGRDAAARAALRAKLAAARDIVPLWDTPRFVQHLEAGYAAVIARQREGLAPAVIDIPA